MGSPRESCGHQSDTRRENGASNISITKPITEKDFLYHIYLVIPGPGGGFFHNNIVGQWRKKRALRKQEPHCRLRDEGARRKTPSSPTVSRFPVMSPENENKIFRDAKASEKISITTWKITGKSPQGQRDARHNDRTVSSFNSLNHWLIKKWRSNFFIAIHTRENINDGENFAWGQKMLKYSSIAVTWLEGTWLERFCLMEKQSQQL